MIYVVNIKDIEESLVDLGGEARSKKIQDNILVTHCFGNIPDNYEGERSFRQTIQRKIEDYCPQAKGFDEAKSDAKFIRISRGLYRISEGNKIKEIPALEEVVDLESIFEGAIKKIAVNVYERSAEARRKCISFYGSTCIVCGFDFELTYGGLGKAFIHVHHIKPLAEIKEEYTVDPIKDLRPVCANCHAIIHRVSPALSIEQLREALTKR